MCHPEEQVQRDGMVVWLMGWYQAIAYKTKELVHVRQETLRRIARAASPNAAFLCGSVWL